LCQIEKDENNSMLTLFRLMIGMLSHVLNYYLDLIIRVKFNKYHYNTHKLWQIFERKNQISTNALKKSKKAKTGPVTRTRVRLAHGSERQKVI